MLQDLRFTFRLMAKERWFSAATLLALALGIGVNAIGFTIINAAFFRGLPFDHAERLFMLAWINEAGRRVEFSYPELQDLRAHSRTFAGLARTANRPEYQRRSRDAGRDERRLDHGQHVLAAWREAAARA